MLLNLFGSLLAISFIAVDATLPTFSWSADKTSAHGVPHLQIKFPDGGQDDVAILKQFNPIPIASHESRSDIDNCIFEGWLQTESDVYVTLTGGCPFEDSFEIQFRSKRMNDYMFKIVKGKVLALKSPFHETEENRMKKISRTVKDVALTIPQTKQDHPPIEPKDGFARVAFPSTGLVMNVAMYYDQTFKAKYVTDIESKNAMRRVVAQAQNLYYWPSLTTRIRLNVVKEQEISESIEADSTNLVLVGKYATDSTIHENAFMSFQNNLSGVVGIGWVGSSCYSELKYRTTVNEWYYSDLQTGQILAHEIGHNLNMDHDFVGSDVNAVRTDSKGNSCTKIGGVMDYYGDVSRWSTCSVEDFQTYYDSNVPFCMGSDTTSTTTTITTTRQTSTTTRRTSTTTRRTSTTTRRTTTKRTTTTRRPTSTTTKPTSQCRCGVANNRIVGGFEAAAHAFPYQVGIVSSTGTSPFCGGSLISPNYVLTAAHCIVGTAASSIRISVGDVNFRVKGDGEYYVNVRNIIKHPNYNGNTQDNDFALLKLSSPVQASQNASFICLPPDVAQTFAGTNLTISGWGTTSSGGGQSPALKAAFITGMTNSDCSATGYGSSITANMICATTPAIDTDTCQGDSGGPMAATINGKFTIVGVTSFGIGCAQPPYPGVYARVTAQKSWILANSDAGLCQN